MRDDERRPAASRATPIPQYVEIAFAARPDMAVLARMTAAAVAARADFGVDQVEDLRLAIDELCVTLVGEDGVDGRLSFTYTWTEDAVHVTGTLESAEAPPRVGTPSELAQRILDALTDEHGGDRRAPGPCMWFHMRRRGVR